MISKLKQFKSEILRYQKLKYLRRLGEVRVGNPVRLAWKDVSVVNDCSVDIGNYVICLGAIRCQKEGAKLRIGDRSFVGTASTLVSTQQVLIGSDVLIAHDCYITDSDGHPIARALRRNDVPNRWKNFKDWSVVVSKPVVIKNDSWIGPRTTILKGVTIGEGAIVCAGSVVTKSVDEMTMVAGVPARPIRSLEE